MTIRAPEAVAAEFLRKALADDALAVPKLETMAHAAGLLGERQRISNAKPFRKAKRALGIESIRDGFGAGGGWLWKLPRDQEASVVLSREASAGSSIKRQPVRAERNVPLDWVEDTKDRSALLNGYVTAFGALGPNLCEIKDAHPFGDSMQ